MRIVVVASGDAGAGRRAPGSTAPTLVIAADGGAACARPSRTAARSARRRPRLAPIPRSSSAWRPPGRGSIAIRPTRRPPTPSSRSRARSRRRRPGGPARRDRRRSARPRAGEPPAPRRSRARRPRAARRSRARRRCARSRGGGRLDLEGGVGDLVTLLPIGGDAGGVTTTGLRWPLDGRRCTWVARGALERRRRARRIGHAHRRASSSSSKQQPKGDQP